MEISLSPLPLILEKTKKKLKRTQKTAFWIAALSSTTRWTVMSIFVWLFITGFLAAWVLRQFIEQGLEWLAMLIEVIPTFGLYRVLYEFSQYSFLGKRRTLPTSRFSPLFQAHINVPLPHKKPLT